jgi:hypothetical protein
VISAPRQKPIVYPMSIEVQRKSIEIIKSIKIGKFGVLYEGLYFLFLILKQIDL